MSLTRKLETTITEGYVQGWRISPSRYDPKGKYCLIWTDSVPSQPLYWTSDFFHTMPLMTGWNSWLTSASTPLAWWISKEELMEKRIIRINPCDSPFWENDHLNSLSALNPFVTFIFCDTGPDFSVRVPKPRGGGNFEGWIWESRACYHMAWFNREAVISTAGQIIATSHDLTPNGGSVREIPFQGNLGWWNIIVWPELVPDFSYQHYLYQKSDCIFSDTNFGQAKTEASKWNSVSWMQIYISDFFPKAAVESVKITRGWLGPRWFIVRYL